MVVQYRLSLLASTNLNNSHKPRFFTLSYVFYIIQARSSRCMNQLNMLSLTSNSSHMKMTRQMYTLKTLQRHFNSHPSLSNPHFIHVFLFFFFFFFPSFSSTHHASSIIDRTDHQTSLATPLHQQQPYLFCLSLSLLLCFIYSMRFFSYFSTLLLEPQTDI